MKRFLRGLLVLSALLLFSAEALVAATAKPGIHDMRREYIQKPVTVM